ncbi:MAG: repressor LexA [Opitutaceae bacterium]|nr:repressor LexA [Opitutaceae bacterium]
MLTDRQEEILAFISEYQRQNTVPPSTRIIQKQFGFASQTSVIRHLKSLATKGSVEQLADGSWGIKAAEIQGRLFDVSVFGTIPAGHPSATGPEALRSIALDPSVFGVTGDRSHRVWALEISGESMIDVHICPGDVGVFERREPRPGEIVAALVDGATTLKRYVLVHGKPVLRAENAAFPDIVPVERLEAQGVLVGLLRRVTR